MHIPERLCWDGRMGTADHDGFHAPLRKCPLPEFVEVDYAPGVGTFEVRERTVDRRRDMTPAERLQCGTILCRMADAARAELERAG